MRFEISKVLDAIEGRVCTDPSLARAVIDLAEVIRYQDIDGGRPASLLRLGMVIDALSRELEEDSVQVYAVVHRALLSDADLTSNERMVVRRWADDGLVEVLDNPGDRMLEVADLLGLPVLTRVRFDGLRGRFPWLVEQPGRVVAPVPGAAWAGVHRARRWWALAGCRQAFADRGEAAGPPVALPGVGLRAVRWRWWGWRVRRPGRGRRPQPRRAAAARAA